MFGHDEIREHIAAYAKMTDNAMHHWFPSEWDAPLRLKESMRYSLEAGGKKLRPVLLLTAAVAVAGDERVLEQALPIASAVEFVHTYSLIHDDLPAMDDDDYRRGRLTNHKVFGEALAILAGDGLLTHAFYLIAQAAKQCGLSADIALDIVEDLAVYAGVSGMVGGQVADMQGEQGITTLEGLEYIHTHKTGDLLAFCMVAGGRIAGASQLQLDKLRTFGHAIGLAFQIQDDILDVIGDEQKLGKKTSGDTDQEKVTYPYLLGLEQSKQRVSALTESAKTALLEAELLAPHKLLGIAEYLVSRES